MKIFASLCSVMDFSDLQGNDKIQTDEWELRGLADL